VLLHAGRTFDAQQSFRYALQLDATERVDSLDFLDDALVREFAAVRAALPPAAPTAPTAPPGLRVEVSLPFDTTLRAPAGKLVIGTRASFRAHVTVTVAPAATPAAAVWTRIAPDSLGGVEWNLRGRDGNLVPSGRYVLRVEPAPAVQEHDPVQHVRPHPLRRGGAAPRRERAVQEYVRRVVVELVDLIAGVCEQGRRAHLGAERGSSRQGEHREQQGDAPHGCTSLR